MKIKVTKKDISSVPHAYVRLALIEKGTEHFVKEGEVQTLNIVAGKFEKITPRTLRTLVRGIVQSAKKHKIEKVVWELSPETFPQTSSYGDTWFWSTIAENLILANYEHTQYKSKKSKYEFVEILIITPHEKGAMEGIARGTIVSESANICRNIANTTGGEMTPQMLANMAKKYCTSAHTKVTILDEKMMTKLGMGGVLGVGQGSKYKPRFIIVEYNGLKNTIKNKKNTVTGPIVFVGKGITFDTGGLQIKPGMAMYDMHMDMSGGAAVIASIHAIAKLGLKKHVIGLIPAAENAVSDEAIRPGDVLTMMSGKTVEVLHTDAEGRIVLADALHYAQRYNPSLVVDVATLTGAAGVAVGQHAHVIITKDRMLEDRFRELGEESGDYTFPLPLWDEYMPYIKGTHADISNIASGDSRYGGTIIGAAFLSHFTKKMPWVHIDMAPRMTPAPSDKLAKGATGEPTRLLVKIAETF